MHELIVDATPPRPFLKWAGGKGRLISQYHPYFPQSFERYHEPFLGGGAIFFHLLPERSRLTDINPELVNVFCTVRDAPERLIALLKGHAARHSKDYYYQMRASVPIDRVERAARLIYLNRTCFNGLYRENSRGQFNVPMGRYKQPLICNADLLRSVGRSLRYSEIQVAPFDAVLDQARDRRDFVYFDPPYYPISDTSKFTAYSRHAFAEADQIHLRDVFGALAQRGVQVMLSNSDCEFIRTLYAGFCITTVSAMRAINSKGDRRGKITEVLITSYQ
ncbi:MAG: DNA adenine methylase [Kaiparowitsia implicata GSE-PSE-MK54-09C]|nr:DNA adenine methylase [Kaiparowitsia implicata GSE-PSE-MK54-09C]